MSRERPIPFRDAEVRSILDGAKTQTRRVIKPQPPMGCVYTGCDSGKYALCFAEHSVGTSELVCVPPTGKSETHQLPCHFGVPGDRLWVKETFALGLTYRSRRSLPCLPPNCAGVSCMKREFPTQEQVDADESEWKRKLDLIFDKGLSACCEAPIDDSQVAKSGRHKGTGYRYCSKCKKVVFHGCGGGQ